MIISEPQEADENRLNQDIGQDKNTTNKKSNQKDKLIFVKVELICKLLNSLIITSFFYTEYFRRWGEVEMFKIEFINLVI